MQSKLFDSELKVMGVLWREGDCTAKHISDVLKQEVGWNMNTTYTVIKRLCDKGCLKNEAAVVTSLVDRATVQQADGQEVLQRSFHGSLPSFLAAFLRAGSVSDQEAAEIEQMLEEYRQSH
mgnify:CR=1 FL=1